MSDHQLVYDFDYIRNPEFVAVARAACFRLADQAPLHCRGGLVQSLDALRLEWDSCGENCA